jgi:hypothetical protein
MSEQRGKKREAFNDQIRATVRELIKKHGVDPAIDIITDLSELVLEAVARKNMPAGYMQSMAFSTDKVTVMIGNGEMGKRIDDFSESLAKDFAASLPDFRSVRVDPPGTDHPTGDKHD